MSEEDQHVRKTDELEALLSRRQFLVRAGLASAGVVVGGGLIAACSSAATSAPTAAPATAAPSAAPASAAAGGGEVIVPDVGGTLAEAFKVAYFDPFTAETGINVTLNAGNFDASVVLAQSIAGAPPYDLNNPNGSTVQEYVAKGACEKIDFSQWGDVKREDIGPAKATDYYVPAYYFALVPAWSTKAFPSATVNGWADVFDTTKFPGKRAFPPGAWGAGGGIFEVALLGDGVAAEKLYPLDVDRALAALKKFKPNILKFWESGAEPIKLIQDDQAVMVAAWNGRVDGGKDTGAPIEHSWGQALLQYDVWAILKGAKNAANAQKLLAFMQRPDRQIEFAQHISYSPGNQAALQKLDAARAKLMPTTAANMGSAITQDYEWWETKASGSEKTNEQVFIEKWQEWIATY
jgi:putative spermidine/putrescine transport system substrate-binding protein